MSKTTLNINLMRDVLSGMERDNPFIDKKGKLLARFDKLEIKQTSPYAVTVSFYWKSKFVFSVEVNAASLQNGDVVCVEGIKGTSQVHYYD